MRPSDSFASPQTRATHKAKSTSALLTGTAWVDCQRTNVRPYQLFRLAADQGDALGTVLLGDFSGFRK